MRTARWWSALPLLLAAATAPTTAPAAEVRDDGGMFSPDAVRQAKETLDAAEQQSGVPIRIETIPSLRGQKVEDVALQLARRSAKPGLFILMAKQEHKIDVRVHSKYRGAIDPARARSIREAFVSEFKQDNFDAGLTRGAEAIRSQLAEAQAAGNLAAGGAPAAPGARRAPRGGVGGGGFNWGSLIGLGLVVLGVILFIRLLGALFGGARRAMGAPPMGGPYRGGYGGGSGGYGGGYGGGGGGFLSSLFGGLGGAMAGNWIYDRMSHHDHGGGSSGSSGGFGAPTDTGSTDWGAGDVNVSGDWGGGGGGGGDWGGGGGDWGGGGGGDWGGGGGGNGGGDW